MEAIWLSFQENNKQKHKHKQKQKYHNPNYGNSAQLAKYATEVRVLASMAPQASSSASSSSPSGGLACAIAALAERQQTGDESSTNYYNDTVNPSTYNLHHDHTQTQLLSLDNSEESAETGYGYDNNLTTVNDNDNDDDDYVNGGQYGQQYEVENGYVGTGSIVPESFEEQMMLAMAVSLAETQGRSSTPEITWA